MDREQRAAIIPEATRQPQNQVQSVARSPAPTEPHRRQMSVFLPKNQHQSGVCLGFQGVDNRSDSPYTLYSWCKLSRMP